MPLSHCQVYVSVEMEKKTEGIVHIDILFKDIQLDYIMSAPEIESLRCCDEVLAVHLPQPIQEKNLKSPVYKFSTAFERQP